MKIHRLLSSLQIRNIFGQTLKVRGNISIKTHLIDSIGTYNICVLALGRNRKTRAFGDVLCIYTATLCMQTQRFLQINIDHFA